MKDIDPSPLIDIIVLGLREDSSDEILKITVDILYEICCMPPSTGSPSYSMASLVDKSLHFFQEEEDKRKRAKEVRTDGETIRSTEDRFLPLVNLLSIEGVGMKCKVMSLSIINLILNTTESLEKRSSIRMHLQNLGLHALLRHLKFNRQCDDDTNELMQIQIATYEEGVSDDQSLLFAFVKNRVGSLTERTTPPSSSNAASISSLVLSDSDQNHHNLASFKSMPLLPLSQPIPNANLPRSNVISSLLSSCYQQTNLSPLF